MSLIPLSSLALATSAYPVHNNGRLKVINLFGGPGAGKSTMASAIFNLMKRNGFSVEVIPEVAKAMTYDRAMTELSNQLLVLAQQEHQLRRLIGQVEYAIVDSPFPMGLNYCDPAHVDRYQHLIDCLWDDYDNYSFRLQRTKAGYQTFGRNETAEQASALDGPIMERAVEYDAGEFDILDPDDPLSEFKVIDDVLEAQGLKSLATRWKEGEL